jgi:inner membrane protein
MPTIISHIAVPLAAGLGLGKNIVSRRLLVAGTIASIVPDLDVIGFRWHVAYASEFGHRGAMHSLFFAALLGLIAILLSRHLHTGRIAAFLFVACSAASHGLLDTFTNGGVGVALFWPWTSERFFAPWREIEVSPFGLHILSSAHGTDVVRSELLWIWLPAIIACGLLCLIRRQLTAKKALTADKSITKN